MSENLTHWKKLHNPDYLGAYALQPGQDLIVTIKLVRNEMVTGTDGKKEECMVAHFLESGVKPMILNATNAKAISKLFKTPYVEKWKDRKIQICVETIKAFGETVEALRIRPFLPKITEAEIKCTDCAKLVAAAGTMNPQQLAEYTAKKYGRPLCAACATKAKAAEEAASKSKDVL